MILVLLVFKDQWGFLEQGSKERRVWKDHVDPREAEAHRVRATLDQRVIKVYQVRSVHQEREEQENRELKGNLVLQGYQDYQVYQEKMALQDRREKQEPLG